MVNGEAMSQPAQKEIYLLRHAQSADKQQGQTDLQRILTPLGKEEVRHLGKLLNNCKLNPELIVTSTAQRAMDTACLLAGYLHYPVELIDHTGQLYEAPAAIYLDIIRKLDPTLNRVMLVAHNPGISRAAEWLTAQSIDLKTCELVSLQFNTDWQSIAPGAATLAGILQPSMQQP